MFDVIVPHRQSNVAQFKDTSWGQNGYEDLRRYIKSGEDLNKELATILQERAEAEMTYAKQLCKLSSKLNRACRDSRGGVATALRGVASDMEGRGDVHRQFSTSLSEEIVRPLKQLSDSQHRARKAAELVCDKSLRQLNEWRAAEAKAKKQSHQAARENEKLQDASLDARLARAPSMGLINHANHAKMHHPPQSGMLGNNQNQNSNSNSHQADKEAARTEQKRKKAEMAVKKADVEYYTLCVRAERARLDWESSVTRACRVLEALERERIIRVKGAIGSYCELSEQCAPLMGPQKETQRALARCDPDSELEHVQAIRRQTEGPCEQLLPDFYCEHTTLAMNRERRKQALVKLLQLVRQDLLREKKSRAGVETLYRAIKRTNGSANDNVAVENNAQDESQQNIEEKLYHIRCMLLYLEGARYKLHAALCELDHRAKTDHPLAPYLRITRDRTGLQQSVLRAPASLREAPPVENLSDQEAAVTSHVPVTKGDEDDAWSGEGRGAGDGLSNQRDSDYDEFSSQGSFNDDSADTLQVMNQDGLVKTKGQQEDRDSEKNDSACETDGTDKIIGYCKALYEYQPALDDELALRPGDVVGVIRREQDGWWVGLLRGRVGVFPATYVQDPVDREQADKT